MGCHFFQAVVAHSYFNMKYIELSHGKRAIVDDEDFERVNQLKWYLSDRGYAIHKTRTIVYKQRKDKICPPTFVGKQIRMHRFILGTCKDKVTDHINGDKLDNRRENLRYCTQSENLMNQKIRKDNTSGYKGVRITRQGHFHARIQTHGKQLHLGHFKSLTEAAEAYNEAAKRYHGNFARLNNIYS